MFQFLALVLLAMPGMAFAHSFSCDEGLDNFMFPKARKVSAIALEHPQVQAIGTAWKFGELSRAFPPFKAFTVRNPQQFSEANFPRVNRMLIKSPGLFYAIPPGLEAARPTLQQIFSFEHAVNPRADAEYAYLTIETVDVAPGETHGPAGYHLEGFHSADRRGEAIDHSYTVSDTLPSTFTTQRFHFHNFDYGVFSLNAELDRQARRQFEVPGVPYQVYLTNGYTPLRETVASEATKRTILRVTFSRAPYDDPGATSNPLLPHRPKFHATEERPTLQKYLPPPNLSLVTNTALDVIEGERLGVVMVGDENVRAAGFAVKMLENAGKKVAYIATMRDPKTFAAIGAPENLPDTVLEDKPDVNAICGNYRDLIAYLDGSIHEWNEDLYGEQRVKTTHERVAPVDALVFVDVGGRSFASSHAQNVTLPEHELIQAIHVGGKFKKIPGYVLALGVGGLPPDSPTLLVNLAGQYDPSPRDRASVLKAARRYDKSAGVIRDQTLNLWLQAMRKEFGPQKFAPLNPQDPLVEVRPVHARVLLLPINDDTMTEIKRPVRLLELK